MAFDTGISSAVAQYVYTQSNGAVTEPIGGSYIQAYCEYLNISEPINNSWLIALCDHFGITQPLNGSWTIALANYYGITYPTGGTWWMALAFAESGLIPTANFDSNVTTAFDGESVEFFDTSTVPVGGAPITAWSWTFPGGTPSTSTLQNPAVQYNIPGNYDVSLEVTNEDGSNSITKPNWITVVNAQIVADFTADNTNPIEGGTVNFTDTSYGDTAEAWSWTFPGGTPSTSTLQNPSVVYDTIGEYDVSLQVFDETGSNTLNRPDFISVSPAVAVDYNVTNWFTDYLAMSIGQPLTTDWETTYLCNQINK